MRRLGELAARGAALTVLTRLLVRTIGVVSIAILARLLTPEDFGLMAMGAAIAALATALGATGVANYLVRHPSPEREHYDTAWTMQLIVHGSVACAILVSAPAAASYYGDPRIAWIVAGLAAIPLCYGLTNIGLVDLQRELRFAADLRLIVAARLAALVATIAAAIWFGDYRALVIGAVGQPVFHLILSYLASAYRPRFCLARAREILSFSAWALLYSVATTVLRQIDRIVGGRIAPPREVGLYGASQDASLLLTEEITGAFGRALMPAASKLQHDEDAFRRVQVAYAGLYALSAWPLGLGVSATAAEIVAVVLGPAWAAATPYMQVLALGAAVAAARGFLFPLAYARGDVRRLALFSAMLAAVLTAGMVVSALQGDLLVLAWVRVAILTAALPLGVVAVLPGPPAFLMRVCWAILRPLIAGLAMYAAVLALPELPLGGALAALALKATVGCGVYAGAAYLLWLVAGRPDGAESQIFRLGSDWLKAIVRRLVRRRAP